MFICLLLLWPYISVVLHELGHLCVAYLVGLKAYKLEVGSGPSLWKGCIGNLFIDLKLFPSHGLAHAKYKTIKNIRWRLLAFTLGGPATNLLLTFIFFNEVGKNGASWPAFLLMIFEIGVFTSNIYPRTTLINGVSLDSDGLSALRLLTSKNMHQSINNYKIIMEQSLARYSSKHSSRELFDGDVDSLMTLIFSAQLTEDEEYENAVRELEKLLVVKYSSDGEKLLVLDHLCCLALYHGYQDILPKLDALSRQALELAPNSPTIKGTRGAILVELERYEEALQFLLPLLHDDNDETDRAVSYCYVARVEQARNNLEKSRDCYRQANALQVPISLKDRFKREGWWLDCSTTE